MYFCGECRSEVKGEHTPEGVICEKCGNLILPRKK